MREDRDDNMSDGGPIKMASRKDPPGVRGIGEIPLVRALSAVANTIRNGVGHRFHSLPMCPPKAVEKLIAPQQKGPGWRSAVPEDVAICILRTL